MSSRTARPTATRRQSGLAAEETASVRRRREETLRRNAERDTTPKPRAPTNRMRPTKTTSSSLPARNSNTRPPSATAAPKGAKKTTVTIPEPTPAPVPAKGTVASMNPEAAVALHTSAKVFEAAAYMAAKRQDAVLVVDGEGHLTGILTDKDLAYRVVANGVSGCTDCDSIPALIIIPVGPQNNDCVNSYVCQPSVCYGKQ